MKKRFVLTCCFLLMNVAVHAQTFESRGNPIITDRFTADPAALVYDDTVYLYVGHDEAKDKEMFNIKEWLCYSSKDMINWTCHDSIMRATDFEWAVGDAWASQVIEKDGKFFFYTTVQHGPPHNSKAIGVAVSDSPTGPFRDARGSALITDGMTKGPKPWDDIDPTVFVDDDGSVWMAWGNGICYVARLKSNMIELDGSIKKLKLPHYVEGPWIHKRNGIYYLTYASHVDMVGSEMIAYATADSMEGPWIYRGVLTDHAERSFTIHPAIIEFKNQSYLFYHNAALTIDGVQGTLGRRSVCVDYLYYQPDGTMLFVQQTKDGTTVPPKSVEEVAKIKNPFEADASNEKIWYDDAAASKSTEDADFAVPDGFDLKKPEVEYGEIKTITYHSSTAQLDRNATIILPPNYDANKKYPVLYLLHGIGGNEREWLGGKPVEVIGNLVAQGKAKEMLVVIPNIRVQLQNAPREQGGFPRSEDFDRFLDELRNDLRPYIEDNYGILPGRDNHAVAGLSMGGRSALHVGLNLIDDFAYIGAFTPAPGVLPGGRGPGLFTKETFTVPEQYRENTLIMITKGSTDGVVRDVPEQCANTLKENGIEHIYTVTEGGHDFNVWKANLYQFVIRIFQ